MEEIIEFNNSDVKPMRKFYNLLWIVLLAVTALLLLFVYRGEPILVVPESEYIKSVVILLLLASIPSVFGWFTLKVNKIRKVEEKADKLKLYEKIWKIRALVVFIVFLLNVVAYILITDKSMAFMVAIASFVFLYCRPHANTLKNELNDIAK